MNRDRSGEYVASNLRFVNALRAVLELEPINGYGELAEVSYADAWPVSSGCRQRCARTDRGNR